MNGRSSSAPAVARGIVPRAIFCAVLRAALLTALSTARMTVLPTLLLSVLLTASAQSDNAARGVAGAYSLRARGVEAPAWNPATLAWSPALDLRIAAVDGGAHNNAFSLGDYRRWNGAALDEQDQEAILARIPGSSLRGGFTAAAEGPSAAWRGWALTASGCAAGSAAVPKEFGRLVFYGNDPEQSFDLGGTRGEGTAWSEFRLSHGHALGTTQIGGRPVAVVGGFTLKWIRGWAHAKVTRAEGSLVTNTDGITGAEELTERSAAGGNGYACDLGVAAQTGGWRLGLTLTNPASHLSWTRRPEEHTQRAWVDSLALDDLEDDEDTDLVSTDDTTRAIASFSTTLPAEVAVAAAHRWRGFDWEADLRQGFSTHPGTSTTPRLALGMSRRPWRFFEGRAGLALGGADGPVLALGAGFAAWKLRCDLGIATTRGINFTSPRGVEAGVSLGLSWAESGD